MKYKTKSIIENDIILIHIENKPSFFARVEKIYPDLKPGWWRVKLLILQVPVIIATWILDNEQIRGAEFTMNGTPVRIEKIVPPADPESENSTEAEKNTPPKKANKSARIISMNKKKNSSED